MDLAAVLHVMVCVWMIDSPVCTTPTTSPTATPRLTTVPGSCFVDGKWYANGEEISSSPDKCFGSYCSDGMQIFFDHECAFVTPPCAGFQEKLSDQCCPICHPTTTPPLTTPGGGHGACFYEGRYYQNGEVISRATDGCYGMYCGDGGPIAWDHECMFFTPQCSGTLEKLEDQCCPICHESSTSSTTSASTTITSTVRTTQDSVNVTLETHSPYDCLVGGRWIENRAPTTNDTCRNCRCSNGDEVCDYVQCLIVTGCISSFIPPGECCPVCSGANDFLSTKSITFALAICLLVLR